MNTWMKSTAVRAPVADTSDATETIERPVYSPEEYINLDILEYRKLYHPHLIGVTDEQLFNAVVEEDDDLEPWQWENKFRDIKRTTGNAADLPNIDGDALSLRAATLAAKVGDECNAVINKMADAKEVLDLGKFRLLFALQSDFEPKDLNGFPVPDSETGNNPDWFKVDKTNADGTTSKVWTTFYTILADNTVMGKNILSNIEMLERMGMPNAMKDDIPADIKELDPHRRQTKLEYWKGRRGTLRKAYKESMKLYFQFDAVNSFPGIKAEPMWADGRSPDDEHADGLEIENTTKPIQVWQIPAEGKPVAKWEALSVGAFMKLDVKKAIEKGGTFQHLIESGIVPKAKGKGDTAAGTGATGNNAAATKLRIETAATVRDVAIEMHRSMTAMLLDKQAVEYGKLLKLMNEKDNDETVTAMVELRNYLNDVCRDAGLDKRYVKLQQAGSELVTKVA